MTIKRKIKRWKYTHRKIRGQKRKVKIHRKRVLDGYLVRVVKKKTRRKSRLGFAMKMFG